MSQAREEAAGGMSLKKYRVSDNYLRAKFHIGVKIEKLQGFSHRNIQQQSSWVSTEQSLKFEKRR